MYILLQFFSAQKSQADILSPILLDTVCIQDLKFRVIPNCVQLAAYVLGLGI
jgi:Flp pilus assembly protein protease CpaA